MRVETFASPGFGVRNCRLRIGKHPRLQNDHDIRITIIRPEFVPLFRRNRCALPVISDMCVIAVQCCMQTFIVQ